MKRGIPLEIFLPQFVYEIGLKNIQPLLLSEEIIHKLTFQCIRKWNSLLHSFMNNHYCLLQLIQQIIVFEEGCVL